MRDFRTEPESQRPWFLLLDCGIVEDRVSFMLFLNVSFSVVS
jgi:hypothetical protein